MKKKITIFITIAFLLLLIPTLSFGQTTLKIGVKEDIKTLNAFKATDLQTQKVLRNIYESLYVYSPETYKIIPWLASGQPKINKSDMTATVKLKKDVKWSDGEDFTADDVVFTAQTFINSRLPGFESNWEFVESVEKIDDYTVKYHLTELRSTFLHGTLMKFIKPAHIWEPMIGSVIAGNRSGSTNAILNLRPTESQTVGTGPFVIKEWNKSQYVSLIANESYHMKGERIQGGAKQYKVGPHVKGLTYRVFNNADSAIISLRRNEIDYLSWEIPSEYIRNFSEDTEINLVENVENGLYYLGFNLRRGPFKNKSFRQAMAWLIDKNYIKEKILKNYGDTVSSVVPKGNSSFHNSGLEDYGTKGRMRRKEREEKARKLLKKAGFSWNKNGKLIDPSGKELFDIQILTPTANYDASRSLAGFLISDWWSAIGVPVTSKPVSFGEILDRVFTERNFDCFILGWTMDVFPSYLREYFHSSQDKCNGSNPTGFKNKKYDKLADEFIRDTDISRQVSKAKKLQEILAEECPYIPLYTKHPVEAYSNKFKNWVNQLNGVGNFWSMILVRPAS